MDNERNPAVSIHRTGDQPDTQSADNHNADSHSTGAMNTSRDNSAKDTPPETRSPPAGEQDADLGNALRSVYQKTVDEDIPAEMLDLLSRLS